MKYGQKLIGIK